MFLSVVVILLSLVNCLSNCLTEVLLYDVKPKQSEALPVRTHYSARQSY